MRCTAKVLLARDRGLGQSNLNRNIVG